VEGDAKRQLRDEMRSVRRRIADDAVERIARSARIWEAIVPLLDGRSRVMVFESLPTEPDTTRWIEWCHAHGAAVFTPEVDGADLRVMPGDVDPATLDVVVVPGLAFTADGHRLGQGGGHFDRFLPRLRPDCLTIGVGYAEQLVDSLPSERHDVLVSHVVVR
jgi:5-formyltetrahydrofolate cyclo-ligase